MPPMFRPPPMRHGMPGHNPMGMRMSGPMMPRLRMPPGPPPGLPPRMMQHHNMHRPQQQVTEFELNRFIHTWTSSVLSLG